MAKARSCPSWELAGFGKCSAARHLHAADRSALASSRFSMSFFASARSSTERLCNTFFCVWMSYSGWNSLASDDVGLTVRPPRKSSFTLCTSTDVVARKIRSCGSVRSHASRVVKAITKTRNLACFLRMRQYSKRLREFALPPSEYFDIDSHGWVSKSRQPRVPRSAGGRSAPPFSAIIHCRMRPTILSPPGSLSCYCALAAKSAKS